MSDDKINAVGTNIAEKATMIRNVAQTSDPKIFSENIFPKYFSDAAQDSYMESQETYKSLFEDQQKYKAVMDVLGQIVYRDMRQQAQP